MVSKLTWHKLGRIVSYLLLVGVVFANGILAGWYLGTGTMPTFGTTTSTLPPELTTATLENVSSAIQEDKTNEQAYGEGWNCVDYAWTVMRGLQWQGISSTIIALTYENGTRHAILAIPTVDKGWVCFDPQSDARVSPQVGGYYQSKKVIKIEALVMKWVDMEQFKDAPAFGIEEDNDANK